MGARLRYRHGRSWWVRTRHWPVVRRARGWHGAQSIHEGGLVHVHSDRDGFPRVLGYRRHPHRGPAVVLRVSKCQGAELLMRIDTLIAGLLLDADRVTEMALWTRTVLQHGYVSTR